MGVVHRAFGKLSFFKEENRIDKLVRKVEELYRRNEESGWEKRHALWNLGRSLVNIRSLYYGFYIINVSVLHEMKLMMYNSN